MRILLVGDAASPHTRRWAMALRDSGDDVLLAGFGGEPIEGVDRERLGSGALSARRYGVAIPRLRAIRRRFRPDVVFAHFVSSYGILADTARGRTPLALSAWGSDVLWLPQRARWHRALTSRALRRASLITYDSLDVLAAIRDIAPTAPTLRAAFGPERSWSDMTRRDEPLIVSPRRLDPFYNVASVIDGFAEAAPQLSGWRLAVFTYGEDSTTLARRVQQLGITERVEFVGPLNRTDVRRWFARARVVCTVPSSDATSAALLEAMAAGCLPIVSDLPANREWIRHGENGLLVTPGSSHDLAEALRRSAAGAISAEALEANRAFVAATASWEATVEATRAQLRKIA